MAAKRAVTGDQKLLKRIKTIQKGLPPLISRERLGAFLVRRMQERYERRVDPDEIPWKERSPNTRGNHPLLEKKGYLRKSLGVLGGANGSGMGINTGAGFRIGIRSMKVQEPTRTVDTAVYGRTHQIGTKRVPRRRIVGIGRLDVKAVDSLMRRELNKLMR